jgi:hypothetical protein
MINRLTRKRTLRIRNKDHAGRKQGDKRQRSNGLGRMHFDSLFPVSQLHDLHFAFSS